MKLASLALFTLACGAPLALGAGVEIGVNIGPAAPEVVVGRPPPPERAEIIPVAPGQNYVWARGHWAWHDRRGWVWISGHWEPNTHPGMAWIAGHWYRRGGNWVWAEGRWVVEAPPVPGQIAEMIASEPPPAPIAETIPYSPGPEFFWIGGHWAWRGGWVWVRGYYARHPHYHRGAAWVAGHWDHRARGYVWVEGRWR